MTKTSLVVRVAGYAACGSVLLALPGCGDRSEASEATREASLEIDRIAGGGGSGFLNEYTVEQFAAASKPLGRTGLDGTDSEKAAAVILASWAELGIASGEDLEISALEREAARRMAEIRTELRAWEGLQARAAANEAIDPSAEIALLDDERGEIETAIEAAAATKNEVDRNIAGLGSQMEALAEESRTRRAEAAKLELRAAQLSAVEAAELAPGIQEHALAAEKKLLDLARVQARADQLATAATEASLNLAMLNEQKSLNEEARAGILADRDAALANAAELRAQAAEAASQIRTLADGLLAFRSGQDATASVDALHETHIERVRSAVAGARQGATAMRAEAKIAMGAANVALGDALTRQTYAHGDLAGLFARLAEATPPLPDRAAYEERATESARIAAEASEAARAAFLAAADEYSGTGVRGEASDLINTLVERLRARGGAPTVTETGDEVTRGDDSEPETIDPEAVEPDEGSADDEPG